MAWTPKESKDLAAQIFALSKADECEVLFEMSEPAHTRFAANEVTTSGEFHDFTIAITSRSKGRSGTARLNEIDLDSLKRAVTRSEELMNVAPVDPEFVEGLGPQQYPAIEAFHETTASAGAADRRDSVQAALQTARSRKLQASGFFETETVWSAIANKRGLFGFHRSTDASWSTTMRTDDGTGSGWAGLSSPRIQEIHAGALATIAAGKAESSAAPRNLDPGRYTVILEPQAVADLLSNLGFAFSARAADEGRGFFAKPGGGNRIGETLFADSVTLASDPLDPRVPGRPWAGGGGGGGGGPFGGGAATLGLPSRRVVWIEKGVVKNLSVDRYWAAKTGHEPVPYSGSIVMSGGTGSVDDLVAGSERALLVTRFWYIRAVNPQTLQLTGLTRDGVWLVEKGKITGPVNNFRFNDGPANLLKNIEAMSAPVSTGDMVVPAIRSRDFNFSSRSDAV